MTQPQPPFDFAKALSSLQETGSRWLHSLEAVKLPASMDEANRAWIQALATEPARIAEIRERVIAEQKHLFSTMAQPQATDDLASARDKRFSGEAWQSAPQFRLLAESYLTTCRLLMESIDSVDAGSDTKQRLRFFTKQYLDALSPSNFLLTNPEAIRSAIESKGETLRAGFENLQADMGKGHISITDEAAFQVGRDVALSPGSVIFENEIFQLIQYAPTTAKVHLRPLLLVPPCINKFYILDLRPDNSFVQYAVAQGFTVFIVSWRNVGPAQGNLTWDDYLANGVVKAIDCVRVVTNVDKINVLGFCVGGTMLACALAVLRRMGHDVVESVTFLTTFIDFSLVGDIAAYVDEAFVERREREVGGGGIVNGAELAFAFSSLRANELVWNYVVNNYLKGDKPPAFDLLFWNGDSTNLPGPWYCYYLRNTYFENNLVKPDKLTMCGVPVDLSYIDMPAFVFAAREDHIVPWRGAFAGATHLSGETRFVLGASGHIAGVVNPASKNKRSYWQGEPLDGAAPRPERWLQHAKEVEGSWWPHWSAWLRSFSGRTIPARTTLGNAAFRPIEAAPGRYVREKN